MDSSFTMGALAGGLIGSLWTKVQALWAWCMGLFIVCVELDGSLLPQAAEWYCWRRLKHTRSPFYTIVGWHIWVRSADKYKTVPMESVAGHSHLFWHGWRPLLIGHNAGGNSPTSNQGNHALQLRFFRWTFRAEQLVQEMLNGFEQEIQGQETGVRRRFRIHRVAGTGNLRQRMGQGDPGREAPQALHTIGGPSFTRHTRPIGYAIDDLGDPLSAGSAIDQLALSDEALHFVMEVRRWADSRQWYRERSIAWRRGALLYGPPGTGKSSLVRAIAHDLDWPVHVYDLAMMSNQDLVQAWSNSRRETPCMVLIEDVDAVFDGRTNVLGDQGGGLTFDCLLNILGGVEEVDGLMVVLTTNDRTKLDHALAGVDGGPSRPGRIDSVVYMGAPDEAGRRKIAQRILRDHPDFEALVAQGKDMTGAQFQEFCIAAALTNYWKLHN